jgi:2-dehydro-3-deoxy-D-gluconate 5-dehydrogenase
MADELLAAGLSALFGLHGRSILVTGAGRGIGRCLARGLADAGAGVVAVSRTAEDLRSLAEDEPNGRIRPIQWDVSQLDRADELIAQAHALTGPVDSVVHAAAVTVRAPADQVTPAQWSSVLTADLAAPFFISTALYRARGRTGAGSHVFVGSLASSIGLKGVAPYAASKSGIVGIVRTLALEWAGSGARVNCLAPGYLRTGLTEEKFADPTWVRWVESRIPLERVGTPRDMLGAAIFLLSPASEYVTGQVLNVDGGWLAG